MSNDFTDSELAARLKAVLKSKSISMKQLGQALNVPYRTIQNYLSGDVRIPATFFLKTCHYLDIDPDYFIYSDFRKYYWHFYDAVFQTLNAENLLPPPEPNDENASHIDYGNRNSFAHKLASSIREKFDFYNRKELKSSIHLNFAPFGTRAAEWKSRQAGKEDETP